MIKTFEASSSQRQGFRTATLLLALLLPALGFLGCGNASNKASANGQAKQSATVTATPPGPLPAGGGDVPWAITDLGELGERIYEDVQAGNWTQTANKLTTLNAAAKACHGIPAKTPDQRVTQMMNSLDQTVRDLNAAVQSKNQNAAMLKANEVTMLAGELSSPFAPQVPIEVTRLDYDGRQLKVWAQTKKANELQATVRDMADTWNKLRPRVVRDGGAAEAKRFDNIVILSRAASSLRQYTQVANSELNEVANLEQFFLRSSLNPNVPS